MNAEAAIPPGLPEDVRAVASALVGGVLAACDAGAAVGRAWPAELDRAGSVRLLAFGKASVPMAAEAVRRLGSRLEAGVVIAPPEWAGRLRDPRVTVHAADHPLPTDRNVDAARALEACAAGADPGQVTLVLISGGGSAHLTLPREGVTLEKIRETTKRMLRAGASIGELNAVRRDMERLKAGGLRRACRSGRVIGLVLSDVMGDDLGTIASGPLEDGDAEGTLQVIAANNRTAVDAAAAVLAERGMKALVPGDAMVGEAAEAGRAFAGRMRDADAVVWGGETTVAVGDASGLGGRNLEVALSAARALPGDRRWAVLTLATDGVDGPTDAAGAVVTSEMLADGRAGSLLDAALGEHDSYHAAALLGALIQTGPTGTNVNDIAVGWWR